MINEGCITKELQNIQLNLNIHEDGIIRLHGRLQNADIPDDSINPILLPIHRRLLHSSPSHTLAGLL